VATTPRAGRLTLDGDEAHAYLDSDWKRGTILPEVAINACIGSTNGYVRGADGGVVPVLGEYEASPAERQLKQRIRDGVLAFQTFWLALCEAKGGQAITPAMRADLDQQAAAMLIRLIEHPGAAEAQRLGNLTHDENYWDRQYTRPLCGEAAEQRLEARGTADFFASLKCYWPQGVVARRHPRLVAALSRQWADPLALGRMGATRNAADRDTRLTDEERATLIELLRHFKPSQVIFGSRGATAMEGDFAALWATASAESSAQSLPTLISFSESPAGAAWHRCVEGELTAPATLRTARTALHAGERHALVLTGEFDAATVTALLNGLAPFLGEKGVIFARCGDSDLVDSAHEHPLTRALAGWLRINGLELGYSVWQVAKGFATERRNWMVFVRGQQARESDDYWQLTLADLPIGARLGGKLWQPPAPDMAKAVESKEG
jgi:predicted secreted protein